MLENGFILKFASHRPDASIFSLEEPFSKELDKDNKLSFAAQLDLLEADEDGNSTGTKIAELFLYLLDNNKILNEGESLVSVGDMLNQDIYEAMDVLVRSKLFKKNINLDATCISLYTCYIDRFYVYPEFRHQGIGSYILANLSDMLDYAFNSPIHWFVTYLNPINENDDTDDVMLKKMKHLFENSGFKELGKSGYYAKSCLERK